MVLSGHVVNGAIVLEPAVVLPEGTTVEVVVKESNGADQPVQELPTLLERMQGFVGVVEDLPPDSSINLDHYLYGSPKRQ